MHIDFTVLIVETNRRSIISRYSSVLTGLSLTLLALLSPLTTRADTDHPDPNGDSVAATYGKLLQPADIESLLTLFEARRFSELDTRMNAFQARYENDTQREADLVKVFNLFLMPKPDAAALFETWLQTAPDSYAAHLAAGIYSYAMGTAWRGDKYFDQTHPLRIEKMAAYMKKAAAYLQQSLRLTGKPTLSYAYLIDISRYSNRRTKKPIWFDAATQGEPKDQYWLDAAIKADPYCDQPRQAYSHKLQPRWGGSYRAMQHLVDETRKLGDHPKLLQVAKHLEAGIEWDKGYSAWLAGDAVTAHNFFNRAIAIAGDGSYLLSRGRLYQQVGQTDLALNDLNQARLIHPESSDILYWRGVALLDKRETNEALTDLLAAANRGNENAEVKLGFLYSDGEQGIPMRIKEGIRWWEKAAYFWNEEALFALGKTYERGMGVPVDQAAAVRYYRIAAAQGHGSAQNDLGLMLWYGQGVPADHEEAIRLWQAAATQNIWQAKHNLNFFLTPMDRAQIALANPKALLDMQSMVLMGLVVVALISGAAIFLRRSTYRAEKSADFAAPAIAAPHMEMATASEGISGKTYRVGMAPYKVIAWICVLFFLSAAVMAWLDGAFIPALIFLAFVALGIYMLLNAASIILNNRTVSVHSALGAYQIRWDEVRWVEAGTSGTLVLHGDAKRLVLPPATAWSGTDKPALFSALHDELNHRGLKRVPSATADYKMNKNVKMRNG